jgi:hypothetical protein
MHEESPNGVVKWRLAGGERRGVLTSVMGKNSEGGGSFSWLTIFIARGERESFGAGPSSRRRAISTLWVPLFLGHWPVGLSQVLKAVVSPKWYGPHCSSVQPTKNWFFYFSQLTEFVNYENHLSVASKFTKLCNLIESKIRNNFPFGDKFKFKIEFDLKVMEAKIAFEFGPNLFGVQTGLEKSDKFPKILFALNFQIVNLDWHGCMAKSEVSHKLSLDLVWKKLKIVFEFEFN